jgi:cytidyltransferase-like protein
MEKIVYTYVVADLLHVGHLYYLERAKDLVGKYGKLIVGVLTDEATMEKKVRPIIPFEERLKLIKALRCVDEVIPQETYSPIPNIKKVSPDFLIESDSHSEEDLKETYKVCSEINCDVRMLPYYDGQSSTKIKEQIKC